jgi:hypothetical protein
MYVRVNDVPDRLTDPGKGEHLWIVTTAHKLPDKAALSMALGRDPGDVMMDQESLLLPPQVGCYKCEEPFSARLYYRKCTGSMEVQ